MAILRQIDDQQRANAARASERLTGARVLLVGLPDTALTRQKAAMQAADSDSFDFGHGASYARHARRSAPNLRADAGRIAHQFAAASWKLLQPAGFRLPAKSPRS